MRTTRDRAVARAIALAALCVVAATGGGAARAGEPAALARLCDLGIALAQSGRDSRAESVFVALLSRAPHDARALNNLGNVHLLRGDPELAAAFYESAGLADSADAGIMLNLALAARLAGDEEHALLIAEAGVRRAGGSVEAARLLGLALESPADSLAKASRRPRLVREQAIELLRAAARSVPVDSTARRGPAPGSASGTARAPVWRLAGARGDTPADAALVAYWKR